MKFHAVGMENRNNPNLKELATWESKSKKSNLAWQCQNTWDSDCAIQSFQWGMCLGILLR